MNIWVSIFYLYVCQNGWIKYNKTLINAVSMLLKWYGKMFWKIQIDVHWLKLKMRKDVTKIDSAGVKIYSNRYTMSCMWFESNIILL